MPTNPFFRQVTWGNADQDLLDSLTHETIAMKGIDFLYVPRELVAMDELYKEDKLSAFRKTYPVAVLIKNVTGFEGDGDLISKFGLEIHDEMEVSISNREFFNQVTKQDATLVRPREGDLLFFPIKSDDAVYEITFVEDKEFFFQLGQLYSYSMRVRKFQLAGEEFATGVVDVDLNEHTYATTMTLKFAAGTGDYVPSERVVQTVSGASGLVSVWDSTTNELILLRVSGVFDETNPVVGEESDASWTISTITENSTDKRTQNDYLGEFADTSVLDLTESNPYLKQ